MDTAKLRKFVEELGEDTVVPTLTEYIGIPNKSPAFDSAWMEHGYMDAAVRLFENWAREHIAVLPGAILEVVRLPQRTPVIFIEIPAAGIAENGDCVLLYGHLDKQPE